MKNVSKFLLICFLSFGIFSCSSDDDTPSPIDQPETPNLVEAAESANLNILLDAIGEIDGLGEELLEEDAITVFAPTDQAFVNLLAELEYESLEALVAGIGTENLGTVLGFHVVPTVAFAADLAEGEQEVPTLSGQNLTVTKTESSVTVTDVAGNIYNVTMPNIAIENGVVHIIDGVLLPELAVPDLPNLVDAAEANGLNALLAAVGAIDGLGADLLAENAITVFAPTDEAFNELLDDLDFADLDALVAGIGEDNLGTVLGFHVVPTVAFAADLAEGAQEVPTLAGQNLTVTKTGNSVTVTDTAGNIYNVTAADVAIENGVVHVIDGVLLPELEPNLPNLVEAAEANGLDALLAAVGAVDGLGADLLAEDAITVFAPTNEAFDDLLVELGFANLDALVAGIGEDNLATVLGFHVVPSVAFAEDLVEGVQEVPTLAGQDLTVTKTGDSVTVTDTAGNTYDVIDADVAIENGVVHVINGVVLPELPTVNEVTMTVENEGASAYFVSAIEGNEDVTPLNENNSTWNLTIGTRYTLNVTGAAAHPFALRNAAGDLLVTQNGASATFQNNADVDVQIDGNVISFTLTPDLANEVDNYVCTVHGSMSGSITIN